MSQLSVDVAQPTAAAGVKRIVCYPESKEMCRLLFHFVVLPFPADDVVTAVEADSKPRKRNLIATKVERLDQQDFIRGIIVFVDVNSQLPS